jgi:hypothetical protein
MRALALPLLLSLLLLTLLGLVAPAQAADPATTQRALAGLRELPRG